jgi:hypothetical protein
VDELERQTNNAFKPLETYQLSHYARSIDIQGNNILLALRSGKIVLLTADGE